MMRTKIIFFFIMCCIVDSALMRKAIPDDKNDALSLPLMLDSQGVRSVDFNQAPISDVVYYVMQQTGIGFVYRSTKEEVMLNWSQFNMSKEDLLRGFDLALSMVGLGCYPANEKKTVFVIKERIQESESESASGPVYRRLSSAQRDGQVYLFDGEAQYLAEDYPGLLKNVSGVWYALQR